MDIKRYVYTAIGIIIVVIGPLQLVDYMASSKDYTVLIKKFLEDFFEFRAARSRFLLMSDESTTDTKQWDLKEGYESLDGAKKNSFSGSNRFIGRRIGNPIPTGNGMPETTTDKSDHGGSLCRPKSPRLIPRRCGRY